MAQIQSSKRNAICFAIASDKYVLPYHESTKVVNTNKLVSNNFLVGPVSVIGCWDLGFVCYLVLEIWDLNRDDYDD